MNAPPNSSVFSGIAERVHHRARRDAIPGKSQSSLIPIAYSCGCRPASSFKRLISALVTLPRTPSVTIVTLARIRHRARTSASSRRACRCRDRRCARRRPCRRRRALRDAGESGEHVDAFGFDEAAEPLDEPVQRDDVVAVVLERRRDDRSTQLAALGQEIHRFVVHFDGQRRALPSEVGDELRERRWIEHGAGQTVGADLARLLEHGNRERLSALGLLQLREPERRRHAGGPAAHDQDIDVELLAHGSQLTAESSFSPGGLRPPDPQHARSRGPDAPLRSRGSLAALTRT